MNIFGGILVGTAMLVGATAALAQSEQPAYVVSYIEVAPAAQAEAASLLKQIAETSRKEAGNLRYDVFQRTGRGHQFAILETWSDLKAAGAHTAGAAMKQFRAKLKPLEASPYDERPSTGISTAAGRAPAPKNAVFVITHVDVTGPSKDDCVGMLKQLAEAARKEPGSQRFEAWQQNNRLNHFTVTEMWSDTAALAAHEVSPATMTFREKLGPMTGALYDDRIYTSLE